MYFKKFPLHGECPAYVYQFLKIDLQHINKTFYIKMRNKINVHFLQLLE